jgi:hypothetical protein
VALRREAFDALAFGLDRGESFFRRQAAVLEVGADVSVAVAPVCEPLGSERRRALVVEVAQALELVECPAALVVVEAAPFEAGVELDPRAVGCAERPEGDLQGVRPTGWVDGRIVGTKRGKDAWSTRAFLPGCD